MPRDNLLNSAALDLFEFIKRDSLKPLIYHLVEQYRDVLESITYVDTFQDIIARYEVYTNPAPELPAGDSSFITTEADTPNARSGANGSSRWQPREEGEQETYFDTSEDDEDDEDELSRATQGAGTPGSVGSATPMKPLVDYDDDDEDEADTDGLTPETVGNEAATTKSETGDGAPSRSTTGYDTPPTSATSPSASADSATSVSARPTSATKRPRAEEDDDLDELSKTTSGVKRRNSGRVALRAHGSTGAKLSLNEQTSPTANSEDADGGDEAESPAAARSKQVKSAMPTRQSARKAAKTSTNGPDHATATGANGNGSGSGNSGDADDPPTATGEDEQQRNQSQSRRVSLTLSGGEKSSE